MTTYRTDMKAIRNISDAELYKAAKKRKCSHKPDVGYDNGFIDGANFMREKANKENLSLREKILELKGEVLKHRKQCLKAVELAKKLSIKLEQQKN